MNKYLIVKPNVAKLTMNKINMPKLTTNKVNMVKLINILWQKQPQLNQQ